MWRGWLEPATTEAEYMGIFYNFLYFLSFLIPLNDQVRTEIFSRKEFTANDEEEEEGGGEEEGEGEGEGVGDEKVEEP